MRTITIAASPGVVPENPPTLAAAAMESADGRAAPSLAAVAAPGLDAVIRVVIADDHPIVRYGLRKLFNLEDDLEVIAEAADIREVLDRVTELHPDIVLMDLQMLDLHGVSALPVLQQANRRTKVIVFSATADKQQCLQAMKLGCAGILLKLAAPDLIVKSIRKVHNGEIWVDSRTIAAVMQQYAAPSEVSREHSPLSQRERELVQFIAQGFKNKEIAAKMFISEQTVKNHLHNIFHKLAVSDRLELALYALHSGWLVPGQVQAEAGNRI